MKQRVVDQLEKSFLKLWPDEPTEKHQDLTDRIRRSISWIRKSLSSPHYSALRFTELWIALNALYGRRRYDDRNMTQGERGTERADFRHLLELLERIDPESALRDLVDRVAGDVPELIQNQFLWLEYWEGNHGIDIRRDRDMAEGSIVRRDPVRLLELAFPRLLVLRNQILHGSASENTQRNQWALRPAVRVLEAVLPVCLGLMIHNGQGTQWPPVPFPGWGTPRHRVRG